jgi:helicase
MVRRITKGVKEELLEIAKMRNVGRVRARALYENKVRTIAELREADVEKLARIPTIGQSLAVQLKRELGQESEAKAKEMEWSGQKALSDF